MKRPFGITVIAVLALISGLLGLCCPVLVFSGSAFLSGFLGTIGFIAGFFLIVGPVLELIFAYGAFKLHRWAWYLGLISTAITVTGVIINIFQGGTIWSALGGSVLPIIIFIYLLTPDVRRAFGLTNGSDAGDTSTSQTENLDEAPPDQGRNKPENQ